MSTKSTANCDYLYIILYYEEIPKPLTKNLHYFTIRLGIIYAALTLKSPLPPSLSEEMLGGGEKGITRLQGGGMPGEWGIRKGTYWVTDPEVRLKDPLRLVFEVSLFLEPRDSLHSMGGGMERAPPFNPSCRALTKFAQDWVRVITPCPPIQHRLGGPPKFTGLDALGLGPP